jgi:phage shock protein A
MTTLSVIAPLVPHEDARDLYLKELRMPGILGRIGDLINANVNAMLDGAEDPEKMANEYLRQLTNEVYEVRTGVAAAMADEAKLEQRRIASFGEVSQWQSKAEAALRAGDEQLAGAENRRAIPGAGDRPGGAG